MTKAMAYSGGRRGKGAVTAPEVLLINGPSVVSQQGLYQEHGQ
jgi:hypothetical protein